MENSKIQPVWTTTNWYRIPTLESGDTMTRTYCHHLIFLSHLVLLTSPFASRHWSWLFDSWNSDV